MASNRGRSWADTRIAGDALVAGAEDHINLLANAPAVDTLTVVRIVGDLWLMYTTNVTVTDSLSIVDCGIGVTSLEAFNAGGASLPQPSQFDEYPPRGWLYVNSQPVQQQVSTEGVTQLMAHFKFDIGAMRKIDKGVLFMTLSQFNITVGGSMQVVGRVRALCLT